MSLELCILASGSSGNCTVLRTPNGIMLIDAGIGPRTTARRMAGTGVNVADVRAICLTHLDSDHFRFTWLKTIQKHSIRLFCHESRSNQLTYWVKRVGSDVTTATFNGEPFEPLDRIHFKALPLEHDEHGSHGFVVDGFGCRIGYATDLGRVPRHLLENFCGVDVLAIESNYDREMEMSSSRPAFLKQRIMGGKGHLSNQEAFEAVRMILDRCQRRGRKLPQHIVLLHRSRECNCPKIMKRLFQSDGRISPRLTLAEQFQRTDWLAVKSRTPLMGEQLPLWPQVPLGQKPA